MNIKMNAYLEDNGDITYLPAGDHTDLYEKIIWQVKWIAKDKWYFVYEVSENGEYRHTDELFNKLSEAIDYIKSTVEMYS